MSVLVFQILYDLIYFVIRFISHKPMYGPPIYCPKACPVDFNLGVDVLQAPIACQRQDWGPNQHKSTETTAYIFPAPSSLTVCLKGISLSLPLRTSSVTGQWGGGDKGKEGLRR